MGSGASQEQFIDAVSGSYGHADGGGDISSCVGHESGALVQWKSHSGEEIGILAHVSTVEVEGGHQHTYASTTGVSVVFAVQGEAVTAIHIGDVAYTKGVHHHHADGASHEGHVHAEGGEAAAPTVEETAPVTTEGEAAAPVEEAAPVPTEGEAPAPVAASE
jgi:hypothetical protein